MGFGPVRAGEDAARAGDELPEPGRRRSVQLAEHPIEDVLSFRPPVGADRGSRDIGHAEIGEDVVDGRAFLAEQLAELSEGKEVAALSEGSESQGPPGPGGLSRMPRALARS